MGQAVQPVLEAMGGNALAVLLTQKLLGAKQFRGDPDVNRPMTQGASGQVRSLRSSSLTGATLMNVGALATIAVMNPPNLAIVCVDNGHYEGNGTPFVLLRVKPADPPAFKRKMDPSGCCNRFRTALLGAA